MSNKTEKPYYETKTFRAITLAGVGVGSVFMGAKKAKQFAIEHPKTMLAIGCTATAGVWVVSLKHLEDRINQFPQN